MLRRFFMSLSFAAFLFGLWGIAISQAAPSGQDFIPTNSDAGATVTVGHFAPFAAETISTSVTVRIDGSDALTNVVYGDIARNVSLAAGTYLIEIVPTGTNSVAISTTINLTDDLDYTLSAIGDGANQPLELFAQVDDNTPPAAGSAKLRITHLAPFAATPAGTQVDICTEAGVVVGGLTNVPYKASSGYFEIPAGDYDLKVAATGSNCATTLIDVPSVRLLDGSITEVVAIGDGANFPPSVTATTDLLLTPAPASVTVGHLAPFASQAISTSVTIRIDGTDVFTNVTYPQIVRNAAVPSGERLIEILPTGSNTVAISATLTLSPSMDYTLSAIGDGANQPLELFAQVDDNTPPAAGDAKLRITHLAPFAATPAGTQVDICTEAGVALPGLTGVAYKDFGYLSVPAGDYDLKVTAAGTNCATALIDVPAIRLLPGSITEVVAIGDGANFSPSLALTAGDLIVLFKLYLPLILK